MKIDTKELIQPKTAAKLLDCSTEWVRQLVKNGKLTGVPIDQMTFLKKKEVENLKS